MIITIPLYIILFIYLAYISILGIFSFINFSHLYHNGALTVVSFFTTFLIITLVVATIFFTFILLNEVDWRQPLTLWNSDWVSSALTSANF